MQASYPAFDGISAQFFGYFFSSLAEFLFSHSCLNFSEAAGLASTHFIRLEFAFRY